MALRRRDRMEAEFRQLFKERFGREYDEDGDLTDAERKLVGAYVLTELLYDPDQFAYHDPVTDLTYEVFYEFDYDHDKAVIAGALIGEKKITLNRGLRQRMELAAFDDWLNAAPEDARAEEIAAGESFAFRS